MQAAEISRAQEGFGLRSHTSHQQQGRYDRKVGTAREQPDDHHEEATATLHPFTSSCPL